MANTTSKKPYARTSQSASKPAVRKKQPSKTGGPSEDTTIQHFTESTKSQLKKLGEMIHEATDKGVHMVREIAGDVQRFSKDATDLTKLKMEIHNLKIERDKLFAIMGEQLRNLYRSGSLSNIKSRFKADFKKLDEIEKSLSEKEKLSGSISLTKGKKK